MRSLVVGALGMGLLAGCSDGLSVGGMTPISVSFQVVGAGGAAPVSTRLGGPAMVAGPPMDIIGTNGTLTLDEVRIIINEVELKRADVSCSSGSGDDSGSGSDSSDDCGEFEIGPRFLDLPLDGQTIEAVTATIPAGVYKELDFEIEDLEDDEEDPVEAALIAAVRQEVEGEFPDWPRKASALVVGSFTPTGGSPVDFRVYLEAEVEIEMELIPNLVVDEAGSRSRDLTVAVSPALWFSRPDGTVMELNDYDYDDTGTLLEFEVEMEDGFTEIEFDD
jgi:hypothetical protein